MQNRLLVGLGIISFGFGPYTCGMEALPKKPPIPKNNLMSSEKVKLGRFLFFDPRLSSTGTVSCNSCHNATGSGTDNLQFSIGIEGKKGGRNSPTVWNAAYNTVQFWDGRAPSLEEQAKGPMVNPVEMGMKDHQAVVERIAQVPEYQKMFKKVFHKKTITIENVVKAIAAYERTLITPDSPFDQYIKGKKVALSQKAISGMKLVQSYGCIGCHSGPNFAGPDLGQGNGFFMKFPVFANEEYEKKYQFSKDLGRFEVTKKESDKNMWRVPTWRNVALTAPYFHNGSVGTLEEAVKIMAKVQLNKDLSPEEVSDIVEFLNSLTGKQPKETVPTLPQG